MLRIEKLRVTGLPPLSFEVRGGEVLAVEGQSGAGKTRLLRAIADLDFAEGYVYLGGVERADHRPTAWRRAVRYVPAEPGWWSETALAHAPPRGVVRDRFERLVANLDVSAARLSRPIAELSMGERRRISLALALADEPSVLLLDEPTVGLDVARSALVEELIRFLQLSGRILLIASHDGGLLERLASLRLQLTPPAAEAGTRAATQAPSAGVAALAWWQQ